MGYFGLPTARIFDHEQSHEIACASLGLATLFVVAILGDEKATMAGERYTPFEGEKSAWHDGFDRYDFVMDEENSDDPAVQARRKTSDSG